MKFTDTEWKIVAHRLECPDSLAESITTNEPEKFNGLLEKIEKISLTNHAIVDSFEKMVILECLLGSTFFCGIKDALVLNEITKGEYLALYRAKKNIERRLNIEIPAQ